jgi:hypothetical protein
VTEVFAMPQYLFLLYDDESRWAAATDEEIRAVLAEHRAFSAAVAASEGAQILGGNALRSTASATTLRPSEGGPLVSDGPFAETKEALGGYYLVEARDLDHALQIAKLCPAPFGGVEVRPLMDVSSGPAQ